MNSSSTTGAGQGNRFYQVHINNRPPVSMYVPNASEYLKRMFPGASYTVNEEAGEIHIKASAEKLLEIQEYRQRYHVGD